MGFALITEFIGLLGCAIAQAVSHWLPTVVAWVFIQAAYVVCGGQSSTGAGFL
jgi:hypothetical protein